jgi:paired amphipathic helix protein Sin3a
LKNFAKALDHQGINFKLADRKSIIQKSLVSEIEVLQMEQKEKRSSLANRYQFDFVFKNREMFQHVHQVLFNYIETSATISTAEEEKIKSLLVDFVPKYFLFKEPDQNGTEDGSKDENMDIDEDISVAFPVQNEESMDIDSTADTNDLDKPNIKKRSSHSIYTNNLLYAFFRLYQMFYSRLLRMKEVSDELNGQKTRSEVKNRVALELGLRKDTGSFLFNAGFVMTEADRFSQLLKDINLFVNNEMDSNDFEDRTRELFWTSGYVIFTVDKLVQAIVKQVMKYFDISSKLLQQTPRVLN